MRTARILSVVVLILLVVTALWGLLTYGPGYLPSLPVREAPEAAGAWGAVVILAVGLFAGATSGACLVQEREPPGGIWTVLAAGVSGAWLGGILPCPCWRWLDISVFCSLVLAFALAVGVGRIGAHWRGKGGDR